MSGNAFTFFKFVIVLQLFFAFAVTGVSYAMPAEAKQYLTLFEPEHEISLGSVGSNIQNKMEKQMHVPIIDMGSLVFHSGNILVDMILNTLFAIPEMTTILVSGIVMLIPIDNYLAARVKLFLFAFIAAMYIISILSMIMNIRSQRGIV